MGAHAQVLRIVVTTPSVSVRPLFRLDVLLHADRQCALHSALLSGEGTFILLHGGVLQEGPRVAVCDMGFHVCKLG
jgi:hypothetical protein